MENNKELLKRVQEGIDNQPFARLLGLTPVSAEPGKVTISCKKREDLLQQVGYLHGGVIGAVAEAASGYAALTLLEPGNSVLGVEYKVNFLRPAVGDEILATATVLKNGRKLIVVDVDVTDPETHKAIAKMIVTAMPLN